MKKKAAKKTTKPNEAAKAFEDSIKPRATMIQEAKPEEQEDIQDGTDFSEFGELGSDGVPEQFFPEPEAAPEASEPESGEEAAEPPVTAAESLTEQAEELLLEDVPIKSDTQNNEELAVCIERLIDGCNHLYKLAQQRVLPKDITILKLRVKKGRELVKQLRKQ